MGYKLGDKATVSIIDKNTGEILVTQELQTIDIAYDYKKKEIDVKMDIEPKSNDIK